MPQRFGELAFLTFRETEVGSTVVSFEAASACCTKGRGLYNKIGLGWKPQRRIWFPWEDEKGILLRSLPLRKGLLGQRPISSNSPKCIFSAAWRNTIYNTFWEGALRAGLLLFPLHPAVLRQFQSLLYGSNYFRVNKGRGREKGTAKRGKLLDIGRMPSAIMTQMLCYQEQGANGSLIKTQC